MPAPSNIVLSNTNICSGMPNGTVVSDIIVQGITSCTGYKLTLVTDYSGAFGVLNNSELVILNTSILTPLLHAVINIRVVDDLGNSLTQPFTINILDCSTYAPVITSIDPTASMVGTSPSAVIYGNYFVMGMVAPTLVINGQSVPLISYTNTQINFALTNLPMGEYYAVVTNGNNLSSSTPFIRYSSTVGPDQNIGNLYCTSKPTMNLVFDSDGPGGKYGATMLVNPPNPNIQYIQVYLKYNYQFNWSTGGEVTLNGVKLITGDKVYLSGQQISVENGIYTVSTGSWVYLQAVTPNTFVDLGARAYDVIDGDISREILTEMGVDFGTVGMYTITYYSMNSLGVMNSVQRIVNVLAQTTVDIGGINGNPSPTNIVITGSISPADGYWVTDYQISPTFDQELVNQLLLSNSFYTPRCPADLLASSGDIGNLPIQDLGIYIRKDGITVFIADESMAGFKLTNSAVGTTTTDSINLGQLQEFIVSTPKLSVQYTAGETISPLQIVYLPVSGLVYVADNTSTSVINSIMGFALNSATVNQPIMVCIAGSVNGFTGLQPSHNYWLGDLGQLVIDAPPVTGFSQLMGIAISTTEFMIIPQMPMLK